MRGDAGGVSNALLTELSGVVWTGIGKREEQLFLDLGPCVGGDQGLLERQPRRLLDYVIADTPPGSRPVPRSRFATCTLHLTYASQVYFIPPNWRAGESGCCARLSTSASVSAGDPVPRSSS